MPRVLSSSRPFFLYKGKGNSTNEIRVSEQARYLGDAPCILSGQDHFFDCEGFFQSNTGESRRTFCYYQWKSEYRNKYYMPPIQSYNIDGDVRNLESWSKGNTFPVLEQWIISVLKKSRVKICCWYRALL